MSGLIRRNQYARPWPAGEPTRPGERCVMSDLLVSECACPKHRGTPSEDPDLEEELDFR